MAFASVAELTSSAPRSSYYDVDLGLVHLYAVDSDSHEPDGTSASSKQAMWLKD